MGFIGGMEESRGESIPIPKELWDTIPAPAQAALLVWSAKVEARIAELEKEVAELRRRVGGGSPPGSAGAKQPNVKPSPPKPKSGKKRGGQTGHARHVRPLAPPDKVAEVHDHFPENCGCCGASLDGTDPEPVRHQVAEIPPIEPTILEHRLHQRTCQRCGKTTRAKLPKGVPTSQFGPRMTALLSLLRGEYRIGIRPIQRLCSDVLGLSISTGAICRVSERTAHVLEGPYNELRRVARLEPANIDETTWRENRARAVLWTMVTATVTVFHIAATKGAKELRAILGNGYFKVVMCDRAKAYRRVAKLQWCWAHLRRDFQAMIQRGGSGKAIGEELLALSSAMFEWWHRMRDGEIARSTMQREITALKPLFEAEMEAGLECGCARTASTCRDLLDNWDNLWRFVWTKGVHPTNNPAEQAHRHAVIWRKSCYGSDSAKGSRFVERLLSVTATCRMQGVSALDYLTSCHTAHLQGQTIPHVPLKSLMAAPQPRPLAA